MLDLHQLLQQLADITDPLLITLALFSILLDFRSGLAERTLRSHVRYATEVIGSNCNFQVSRGNVHVETCLT